MRKEIMSFDEDVAKWIAEGSAYFERRDEEMPDGRSTLEVAEQFYDRALRYDPTNEIGLSALGVLYVSTGRGPLAMKRLNRARREHPESIGPYRAISLVMRISGKLEPAILYFKDLLDEASEANKAFIHLSLAELYSAQENIGLLQQELQHLSTFPPIAPITQGILYLEDNSYQGIDSLLEKLPEGPEKETLKGMSAEAKNDWGTAGHHYFQASNDKNPTWYALNALASMWLQNNQIQHCKAYLEQAEQIAPNAPEVILTKARLYQVTDKGDKARKLKADLLKLKGCCSRVRRMAKAYLR